MGGQSESLDYYLKYRLFQLYMGAQNIGVAKLMPPFPPDFYEEDPDKLPKMKAPLKSVK